MLSLFSSIYGTITSLRNTLYDKGVLEVFDSRVRVISVGNITTGGTGKTPLVALIAGVFANRGEKVCILTRGYGRKDPKKRVLVSDGSKIISDAENAGDEPFELATKLLGKAIVIADADRIASAKWAKRKFGVTVFLLDDGFQHRKLKRDLDIVCIDATDDFATAQMLPSGRLREHQNGLKRAGAIVITRSNLVSDLSELRAEIAKPAPTAPLFVSANKMTSIFSLNNAEMDKSQITGKKAFAFCALGNPDNFFEQLCQEKLSVVGTKAFRDHHIYSQSDIAEVDRLALEHSAEFLLTTAKDAVKLTKLSFEMPCYVVEVEMVLDDVDGFLSLF